jgi:hypothetical protein
LGQSGCIGAYLPVGTTPDGSKFYYLQSARAMAASCETRANGSGNVDDRRFVYSLISLDLSSGQHRNIARFAPKNRRLEAIVPSADFSRIAVVEYTEASKERGQAFVIDTNRGIIGRYAAPVTPYGVSFSADQNQLLIYSAKAGNLVKIHLNDGKMLEHKSYRLGHALGFSQCGKYVYTILHSGVEIRDAASLKRISVMPHRPYMGQVSFVHIGGSAVFGGTLFVKNGDVLYILKNIN